MRAERRFRNDTEIITSTDIAINGFFEMLFHTLKLILCLKIIEVTLYPSFSRLVNPFGLPILRAI